MCPPPERALVPAVLALRTVGGASEQFIDKVWKF